MVSPPRDMGDVYIDLNMEELLILMKSSVMSPADVWPCVIVNRDKIERMCCYSQALKVWKL